MRACQQMRGVEQRRCCTARRWMRGPASVARAAKLDQHAGPSTSSGGDHGAQPQPQLGARLLAGCAAAAASSLLLLGAAAGPGLAVSGGGGYSNPVSDQDFSNLDLTSKKFTKATMRKTNFSGSNLTGVSLFGALAERANFTGANLTNADLESGNFEGADFTNAILVGAFVNNAQFPKVTITGSDWSDVVLRKDTQAFLCKIADGTNPVTGVDTRESLLCP